LLQPIRSVNSTTDLLLIGCRDIACDQLATNVEQFLDKMYAWIFILYIIYI